MPADTVSKNLPTVAVTDAGHSGEVAVVAAAMLRYVLAGSPKRLRMETESLGREMLLHITYPARGPGGPPDELTLIDSLAERWGHAGDTDWHMLWAVLPFDSCDRMPRCGPMA